MTTFRTFLDATYEEEIRRDELATWLHRMCNATKDIVLYFLGRDEVHRNGLSVTEAVPHSIESFPFPRQSAVQATISIHEREAAP